MLFYVAVGSALGGMGRYLLGGFIHRLVDTTFPLGTLLINISGSLLLGLFIRYATETASLTPEIRAFLTIGLCGGYTTFSSFSYETVALLDDGAWTRAALYVLASVTLSLLGTLFGFGLAREIIALQEKVS
ncbi:MAG TPA: fluoride efflux transporter CrcB [Gemmatimonadales bacterium]|jgi:CrcB protein|nr:fluoride efflux transporter CrcB [Gemmatimonadales bacterium]